VCTCEVAFILTAYCHATYHNEISSNTSHISAVLDDDTRSVACAGVGFAGLLSLLALESARLLPRPLLRTFFAASCGAGIIATCVVRESAARNAHRIAAMLAFGAGTLLVVVVASLSRDPNGLRAAAVLTALVLVTGAAQGTHIIASEFFERELLPSWALGLLEIGLSTCAPSRLMTACPSLDHLLPVHRLPSTDWSLSLSLSLSLLLHPILRPSLTSLGTQSHASLAPSARALGQAPPHHHERRRRRQGWRHSQSIRTHDICALFIMDARTHDLISKGSWPSVDCGMSRSRVTEPPREGCACGPCMCTHGGRTQRA
jgi:hypothetical protein